ncbi:MAG: STM3941 family protein [Solirubrobacteraceae bacterium]|nr:STM3941 family protein [Solirubrobacteraceae bacterium]
MHTAATLPAIELRARPLKQLAYLAGSVGFVLTGAWMATSTSISIPYRLWGVAGVLFFGLCAVEVLRNIVVARGRVVTLSAKGLTAHRVSASVVPWEAMTGFSVGISDRHRWLEVRVTPETWTRMQVARWLRLISSRRATPRFTITAQATDVSFQELEAIVRWYHGRATGTSLVNGAPPIDLTRFAELAPVAA